MYNSEEVSVKPCRPAGGVVAASVETDASSRGGEPDSRRKDAGIEAVYFTRFRLGTGGNVSLDVPDESLERHAEEIAPLLAGRRSCSWLRTMMVRWSGSSKFPCGRTPMVAILPIRLGSSKAGT